MNTKSFVLNATVLALAVSSTFANAMIKDPTRDLGLIESQSALSSTYVGPWASPAEMPIVVAKSANPETMTDAAVIDSEPRWPQHIADQIQQYGNAGMLGD